MRGREDNLSANLTIRMNPSALHDFGRKADYRAQRIMWTGFLGREMSDPQVSVVVVGWRSARHLTACLDSVRSHAPTDRIEILVVLNEPTPGLVDSIRARDDVTRCWTFRTNLGFGGAVNHAAAHARGEFLLLLNDDGLVEPHWLETMLDTMRRRPRAGAVGSTFLNMDGSMQEAGSVLWSDGSTMAVGHGGNDAQWDFERQVDYCSGGSLLVRRALWQQLGGFDDRYYPAYYEDVDLCLRIQEAGWQTWYQPRSRLRHIRAASSHPYNQRFMNQINRERFAERWPDQLATREDHSATEIAVWRAQRQALRVLVIDDRLPAEGLGSGFGRARDMLWQLADDPELHVSLHPREGVTGPTDEFCGRGIRIVHDLASHLSTVGVDYDVVVVSRPHNGEIYGALLAEHLPDAHVVYDAEALYHRRLELQAGLVDDDTERDRLTDLAAAMAQLEFGLASQADTVVCISESEAELMRAHTRAPVAVVHPMRSTPQPTRAGFEAREHLGFVAGWLAGPGSPNSDALLWFATEVLPLVQVQAPTCRLLVTGGSPPHDVAWLAGSDVEFVGAVPDLRTFYDQIRVAISPTRFGAGVKLKTVEAIQYGVPVVATPEGAAGLDEAWRSVVSVGESPEQFASCVVDLLTDARTWGRYRRRGLAVTGASRADGDDARRWPQLVRSSSITRSRRAYSA